MTEVIQYREDVPPERVLHELMQEADNAMMVDCADPRIELVVRGWFLFPKGSLVKAEVDGAA